MQYTTLFSLRQNILKNFETFCVFVWYYFQKGVDAMNQSRLQGEWIQEIIDKYAQMVYRIAVAQMKNRYDADDVFQEVFLRLCRHNTNFESDEHVKAWLIRVTVNCSKTSLTSPWRKKTVEMPENLEHHDEYQDFEVLPAVQSLPSKYAAVVHLFYFEDMSVAEISTTLKMPVATVKTRLSRARKLLKDKLGGACYENQIYT